MTGGGCWSLVSLLICICDPFAVINSILLHYIFEVQQFVIVSSYIISLLGQGFESAIACYFIFHC